MAPDVPRLRLRHVQVGEVHYVWLEDEGDEALGLAAGELGLLLAETTSAPAVWTSAARHLERLAAQARAQAGTAEAPPD